MARSLLRALLTPFLAATSLTFVLAVPGCGSDDDAGLFSSGGSAGAGVGAAGRGPDGEGGAGGDDPDGEGGKGGSAQKGGSSAKGGAGGKGGSAGKAGAAGNAATAGTGGGAGSAAGGGKGGAGGKAAGGGKGGAAGAPSSGGTGGGMGVAGAGGAGQAGNGAAGGGATDGGAGGSGAGAGTGGSGQAGAPDRPLGPAELVKDFHDDGNLIQLTATKTRLVALFFSFPLDGHNQVSSFAADGSARVELGDDTAGEAIGRVDANRQDERVIVDRGSPGSSVLFAGDGSAISFPAVEALTGPSFVGTSQTPVFCGRRSNGPVKAADTLCYDQAGSKLLERLAVSPDGGGAGVLSLRSNTTKTLYGFGSKQTVAWNDAASGLEAIAFGGDAYVLVRKCASCGANRRELEWGTVPAAFPKQPLVMQGSRSFYPIAVDLLITPSHVAVLDAGDDKLTVVQRSTGDVALEQKGILHFAANDSSLFYAAETLVYRRALP